MAQDTLSTSVDKNFHILEIDIVCSCNSRITSYKERSAFLRIFSFRRTETLVFTIKVMRYLHFCFMTLAFPRVAFFIVGILLSLANKCESSSHGSRSWIRNITMLSVRAKRLSQISIILFVLGSSVCSVLSRLNSSEALSSSLLLSLLFWIDFLRVLRKGRTRTDSLDFYIVIYIF